MCRKCSPRPRSVARDLRHRTRGHSDERPRHQGGAVDFLTKPVEKEVLIAAVDKAMARGAEEREAREHTRAIQMRYDRLTPREREVFAHLIGGQLNKQAAFDLGTSERTIKAHRHSIMQKLEADSIADLIRVSSELHIRSIKGER